MRYLIEDAAGARQEVDVREDGAGRWELRAGDRRIVLDAARLGPALYSVLLDGRSYDLEVHLDGDRATIAARGRVLELRVVDARRAAALAHTAPRAETGPALVRSPMPGRVVRVACAVGDRVARGAGVVVVEAMKMENELRAPRDGTVTAVHVRPGDPVESGARLVELA